MSLDLIPPARAMLRTPFHHQGRVPGEGLDCAGLIVCACRAVGLDPPDMTGYSRSPSGRLLQEAMESWLLPADAPAPGRVVLIRFERELDPAHVALVADHPGGGLSLIHAYLPARRVVEHALDATWAARIVKTYRIPGA